MSHWVFLYDQTKCIGCNTCQMACKDKNNLEKGMFFRRVQTIEYEENGSLKCLHYSGGCNHCEKPACVQACPTGAMHRAEDGTVAHDSGKCIGCGTCTWSCPYRAPKLSRKLGIVQKCDSCQGLRNCGQEPACVSACLTHCLQFVDLEQEAEGVPEGYEIPEYAFLPEPSITRPSIRIKKR